MLYKTACATCGKPMWTYATNKMGSIPTVYCSKICESKAKEKDKYVDRK